MPEAATADLIVERELRAATGIDHHSLRRLRRWLFIKPQRVFRGRGKGSESYYPATAVPMISRFNELRRETRKRDEIVWRLWLEGFPFPISEWADERLASWQGILAALGDADDLRKSALAIASRPPKRSDPRRLIASRLKIPEENSLLIWAIEIMAGLIPAKSLYDPGSPSFSALKTAGGLTGDWEPPDAELAIESFSLAHFREILRTAKLDDLDQARRDWEAIAQLAELSEAIDWHVTRKALNMQRTSSVQPLAPADFLLGLWRNIEARAILLPGLIQFRRSPEHSHKISEILAFLGWALAQFPRHSPADASPDSAAAGPAEAEGSLHSFTATAEPGK